MINRRILRVKTMQSLYAYRVVKDAIFELAKSHLGSFFEPNYMAKVPEDRGLLRKEEKIAQDFFEKWVKDKSVQLNTDSDKINNSIKNTIQYYEGLLKNDISKLKKKLVFEIEQIYDKYVLILAVLEHLQLISANQISGEKNNFRFNNAIEILKKDKSFELEKINRNVSWAENMPLLRKFFRDCLLKDVEFISYQSITSPTIEEDKSIVLYLLRKPIFEDEALSSQLEENDLYWEENKNILKGMLKKTIKSINNDDEGENLLLELSSNWADDKEFIVHLFEKSLELEKETLTFITEKAVNWDSERLALTDIIILNLGLAEILNFPNIPVKVSINEYIEVSKIYSTPKSKQFINGLLDSISKDLQKDGRIRKSGRGLIDTK